jgi:hypothetical protein
MESGLIDVAILLLVGFLPLAVMAVGAWRIDHPRQNRKLPYLYRTAGHRVEGVVK